MIEASGWSFHRTLQPGCRWFSEKAFMGIGVVGSPIPTAGRSEVSAEKHFTADSRSPSRHILARPCAEGWRDAPERDGEIPKHMW